MISEDKVLKRKVMKGVNASWRTFKSRLTNNYFTKKTKNEVEHPPWVHYSCIEEEHWKDFKRKREDDQFQVHIHYLTEF